MARDFAPMQEFYLQLHELQPPVPHYHHYDMQRATSSTYEMTAGAGASPDTGDQLAFHQHTMPPQQDPRKRKHLPEEYEMTNCDSFLTVPRAFSNKRRLSSYGTGSACDDDGTDDAKSSKMLPDRKQNHSEIEKRRRDKMNTYISELSAMVPMCGAMARKLDKLTVLRMAVQHLRSVRGALSACPLTARPRPAFLSERELNGLILQAARDCFLLVVGCDRGRLMYVSASVKQMLHYDQSELLGQSLFDILHPKDVAKVKEQLSSSDLSPRERLIDAKTMLPVKADVVAGASRLCPGARRSFYCRIKCKASADNQKLQVKEEADHKMRKKQQVERKYCVVQCTGYLKSWAPAEMSEGPSSSAEGGEDEACNLSCLVAVGRAIPDYVPSPTTLPSRRVQYTSRHAPDGRFLFVDQRVTFALGFLPQELLGTSLYEYVSGRELGSVAQAHKTALLQRDALHTPPYSFRRKDGTVAIIQTHFKPFRNPWTKDVECLIANNTIVADAQSVTKPEDGQEAFDLFKQEPNVEMQRLIDSQVESHKIGSAIAEEALRRNSSEYSPDITADLLQDAVFNQHSSLVDNILGVEMPAYSQVRNNVPLSSVGGENSPPPTETRPPQTPTPASPPLPPLSIDGNGEAAMAVIMSLLEADAGLGGPVNFSGLPWPLP